MAPKATDLTDEGTLRAFRPIKRTDAETVARIALLISAMSNAVRRYTQRQLEGKDRTTGAGAIDPDTSTSKTFVYDGQGYLSLAPFEAREVVSVALDGNDLEALAPGEAIGTTRYLAHPPQGTPEATHTYLDLPKLTPTNDDRPRLVTVTAKWGILQVPDDVELAVLHAVADAYGNPEGAAQRNLGDGLVLQEDNDDNGGSLPRASRALLGPLVRRR